MELDGILQSGSDLSATIGSVHPQNLVASATCGLVVTSVVGGPIANHLMSRYRVTPVLVATEEVQDVDSVDGWLRAQSIIWAFSRRPTPSICESW